jgi:hypothetical protein
MMVRAATNPIRTALPGLSAAAGIANYRRSIPRVKDESRAAT